MGAGRPLYASMVGLLEREPELARLRRAMRDSARSGQVVAVTGEAGAGKTSLLRAATSTPTGGRVVRGLCDPLATPRPLGPVRDILAELARVPGAMLPSIASRLLREARDIARVAASVPERQVAVTLPAQLRAIEQGVTELSEQISRQYFAILPLAQRVGGDEETPPLRGMA